MMRRAFVGGCVGVLMGRGVSSATVRSAVITVDHGFVDVSLPIDEVRVGARSQRLKAKGLLNGALIGFEAEIEPASSQLILRSVGFESDSFVAALARAYQLPSRDLRMLPEIVAEVVELSAGGASGGVVEMKVFFNSDDEDRYAEAFLNLNLAAKTIQLGEKDPDYRRNIMRSLAISGSRSDSRAV